MIECIILITNYPEGYVIEHVGDPDFMYYKKIDEYNKRVNELYNEFKQDLFNEFEVNNNPKKDLERINKIYDRVSELNGLILIWA